MRPRDASRTIGGEPWGDDAKKSRHEDIVQANRQVDRFGKSITPPG
jgi:hypothetical protein